MKVLGIAFTNLIGQNERVQGPCLYNRQGCSYRLLRYMVRSLQGHLSHPQQVSGSEDALPLQMGN